MYNKTAIKNACTYAIQNILKEGITDVDLFSIPFEVNLLKESKIRAEVEDTVVNSILSKDFATLKLHKIGHVLMPKKDLCDFRKCAYIEIVDEVTFLTMVLTIAKSIEKERIPKSQKRVFSYRFALKKEGNLFDANYHYTAFKNEVERKKRIKTNKVLVECDISNFYDRLNIHRIESSLMAIDNIDCDIVKLINETLLFWANRDSYGLPVGSNASRILAEAALINVDRYLLSHKVDFCRFVDDYRIFSKDASTAHKHLALLTHCLSHEGLFINTHKTKMSNISSFKPIESEVDQQEDESRIEQKETPKIIRGYSGLIPTKFRELTLKESQDLIVEDINKVIQRLQESVLIEPQELKKAIKMIVAHQKFGLFLEIAVIIKKFPQFIPYFVDSLLKKKSLIDVYIVEKIYDEFGFWFLEEDVPEYILVYLTRLFKGSVKGKNILLDAFRNLRRVAGDYIGRALLESFEGQLSRTEVIEIREYFTRADSWEKRQILKLVGEKLPAGEKRAFFKDVKIHNQDPFIKWIISQK